MKNIIKIIIFFSVTTSNISWGADGAGTVVSGAAVSGGSTSGAAASGATGAAATGSSSNGFFSKVREYTSSPEGIIIMSGIGLVYSQQLYDAAAKQEDEAKANIVKLDRIIATFKDSYAGYCPNGRESLSEPKCYCYLASGLQNPDRSKSQTCIDLWAKDTYKIVATAADYAGAPQVVDPVGCVALNGQFDQNCQCKKLLDPKGNNACMKTTNVTIPASMGSSFASTGLNSLVNTANNAANGNPQLNLLNPGTLNQNAINMRKLADQVITKIGPGLPANILAATKMNDQNVGQYAKAVLGEKAIQAAAKGSGSALSVASSRAIDPKANEALKAAASKAGLELDGSGKGLGKKTAAKEGPNFNFAADTGASGAAGATQNFPETTKVYKINSDISKNSDSSIFDIISNRYVQSGLKRLFEN